MKRSRLEAGDWRKNKCEVRSCQCEVLSRRVRPETVGRTQEGNAYRY